MTNQLNEQRDAKNYFSSFFNILKGKNSQRFGSKADDQLPYRDIALRNSINAFPCPVSLIKLHVDRSIYSLAESEHYYLINFDISNLGEDSINHLGEYNLGDINTEQTLIDTFALDSYIIDQFKHSKMFIYAREDHWAWCWFVPDHFLTNPKVMVNQFLTFFEFTFRDKIQTVFGKEIDYSTKYGLENDPIYSPDELLQIDKTVSSLFKPTNKKETDQLLKNLQHDVNQIQLSPKIPEDVKKIFAAAKMLYIYGYFEYYFFTISQHYTFLALESALRNKHCEIFGKPKKHLTLYHIIKDLRKEKVIREADAHFYLNAKNLRNYLSHLTRPIISMPKAKILENTAFFINQLFEEDKYI